MDLSNTGVAEFSKFISKSHLALGLYSRHKAKVRCQGQICIVNTKPRSNVRLDWVTMFNVPLLVFVMLF